MIQSATFRYCIFDELPIAESPVYITLRDEFGAKIANRYTRVMRVNLNHPPPEVTPHVEMDRSVAHPTRTAV